MEISRESQIAGDNSQQIQAGTIVINQGISEQRVREVCSELAQQAIAECTAEATAVVQTRMNDFANVLIPRIQQLEEDFHSFSDPSFQVLLRKAQLTAACTEREDDYKILSELLIHRVKNKTNIKKKASIAKAVEIIDQIDDDSLNAMTLFLIIIQFGPLSGSISKGLEVLDVMYSKLGLDQLPYDKSWIDNLSILGALNAVSWGSMRKYEDFIPSMLSGYVCAGIKKGTEAHNQALSLLKENSIIGLNLIDNELLPDYVRLPISYKEYIDKISFPQTIIVDGKPCTFTLQYTEKQKSCLKEIWNMYDANSTLIDQVKTKFIEKMDTFPNIVKTKKWWNSLKGSINLTSVGRVIAHTNAKSIDNSIPDLD